VAHGYFVRGTEPREQVTEVVRRFHLTDRLDPFTRCMACNGMLVPVDKQAIAHRLPEGTRERIDEFRVCSSCEKVYWEGAHHPELRRIVEAARRAEGLESQSPRPGVGIHSVADRTPPDETVDRPRRIPLQTPSSS
jgi:uncharacterized protein with PIN domain